MPKKKGLSRTRSIYISDESWEKLEAAAKAAGYRSASGALEMWLQGNTKDGIKRLVKP